jgi:hypothetical protein
VAPTLVDLAPRSRHHPLPQSHLFSFNQLTADFCRPASTPHSASLSATGSKVTPTSEPLQVRTPHIGRAQSNPAAAYYRAFAGSAPGASSGSTLLHISRPPSAGHVTVCILRVTQRRYQKFRASGLSGLAITQTSPTLSPRRVRFAFLHPTSGFRNRTQPSSNAQVCWPSAYCIHEYGVRR